MTKPATLSLNVYQGQDFVDSLALQNSDTSAIDLTGFTARMQARTAVDDPLVIIDWSSADGEIILGGTAGTITFDITALATAALPTDNEYVSWVYDLVLTSSTLLAERLIQGTLNVSPSVTRGV